MTKCCGNCLELDFGYKCIYTKHDVEGKEGTCLIIVQKYGGTSIGDNERLLNVAKNITEKYREGYSLVVVLSAMGSTTDKLISLAKEVNPKCSKRELDMLISTGEQQSVALMAMAIHSLGSPAISLNAVQSKILCSSDYGNARIQNIETQKILSELERKNIVLVTGFQGVNRYGDVATLGRGGSDTTAVALAAALSADTCEIYTDVDGIYTADPRIVPTSKKLKEISYDEMLELASLGARVLHSRSVELAKKHNVKLVVKSSLVKGEGTVVKETTMEKMLISGLAIDKDVSRITVVGMKDLPGIAFKLFSLLAKKNIIVDLIVQTTGGSTLKDISFTVHKSAQEETVEILEKNADFLGYESLSYTNDLAKLSVVGGGMASNPGVAASIFEALYDIGVNVKMISSSEIKISVLIEEKDAEIAANSVHEKLMAKDVELNR